MTGGEFTFDSGTKYTEADKYFDVNNPGVFHITGFSCPHFT